MARIKESEKQYHITGEDIERARIAYNKFREERGFGKVHRNYKKKLTKGGVCEREL